MTRIAGIVLVTLGALLGVARRAMLVAHVRGTSMTPTFSDGDRLLAVRRRLFRRLRKGDVVVCRLPSGYGLPGVDGDALLVKRVAAVAGDRAVGGRPKEVPAGQIYVRGDAPGHSLDSDDFGPLPEASIVGVVVRRMSGR